MIDRNEAAAALSDIADIADRVRQSRIYQVASLIMMLWGVLVFGGYLAQHLWPREANLIWVGIDLVGFAGSAAISYVRHAKAWRVGVAFVILVAFGLLWTAGIGHFDGRQASAFWPTYYMTVYAVAGLWLGPAFVVIAIAIMALTLVGYFYSGPWFDVWMAFVNGAGLIIAGAWMRRD